MKKLVLLFSALVVFFSCAKDNEEQSSSIQSKSANFELIGNWKLIETLLHPGIGEAQFIPVESEKIITFNSDGTITSNGNLCFMTTTADGPTAGTFNAMENKFNSNDCNNPNYFYTYEHHNNILIVNYPCIEPCQAKFQKQP
jgi:hypothetical protein